MSSRKAKEQAELDRLRRLTQSRLAAKQVARESRGKSFGEVQADAKQQIKDIKQAQTRRTQQQTAKATLRRKLAPLVNPPSSQPLLVSSSSAAMDERGDEEEEEEDVDYSASGQMASASASAAMAANDDDDSGTVDYGASGQMASASASAAAASAMSSGPETLDGFLGKIANEVQGANRNDVITVLKMLAWFDSIHDFWPERATKGATDEDEDEPEELDENRLKDVHTQLVKTIATYLNTPLSALPATDDQAKSLANAFLAAQTGDAVTSTSAVEDRVLAFFKKKYAPFNLPEKYMTLDEILSSWKFTDKGSDWNTYRGAIGALPEGIEIVFNGRSIKSLTDAERNTVAFFLLSYLNPTSQPGAGAVEYFTFDMAPRDIGKIFARIEQVKNAIYPQNIADSATTSFSALLGRSAFFHADGSGPISSTAPPSSSPKTQDIRSNVFTWGKYKLRYVDTTFGPTNKFGFKIQVLNAAGTTLLGEIPFGPRNEQGPSVNYLMDLISKLKTATTAAEAATILQDTSPTIGTVAKLYSLNIGDISLLFDIKRKGDWEQMLLRGVTAITGDRFAAALRRLLRRGGMYHSSRGIKAWRGSEGLTPAQVEERSRKFRIEQVIGKLAILNGFRTTQSTVRTQLNNMRAEALRGATSGYVFSPPLVFPPGPITLEYIASNYTGIAATFATMILRYRMRDLVGQIDALITKLDASVATITSVTASQCVVQYPNTPPCSPFGAKPPPPYPPGEPSAATINSALEVLEETVKNIEELESLNISFSATTNSQEPIYVKLFEPSGKLIKGATSLKFNFSAGPYSHPETGIATVVARLLVNSRARRPDAVKDQINKLLVQYFGARDAAKEAFYDKTKKERIETATDISIGLTPSQVVGASPVTGSQQGLLQAIRAMASLPMTGGGEEQLTGGNPPGSSGMAVDPPAPPPQSSYERQYRDIHDLFVELCYDADLAIERINSINDDPAALVLTAAVERKKESISALDEIEAKWTQGIVEIRNQSLEEYGIAYQPNDATDYVSFVLSFRGPTPGFPGVQEDRGVFKLNDTGLYPTRPERGRTTLFEDSRARLLTAPDVELTLLKALQKFLTGGLAAHPGFSGFSFTPFQSSYPGATQVDGGWKFFQGFAPQPNIANWSFLPTIFRDILISLAPRSSFGTFGPSSSAPAALSGGPGALSGLSVSSSAPTSGLGASSQGVSNASSGSPLGFSFGFSGRGGRRGLYARLRQRAGEGTSSEL